MSDLLSAEHRFSRSDVLYGASNVRGWIGMMYLGMVLLVESGDYRSQAVQDLRVWYPIALPFRRITRPLFDVVFAGIGVSVRSSYDVKLVTGNENIAKHLT